MSTDPSPELLAAFRLFVEQANYDVLRRVDKERFHEFIRRAHRERWEAGGDEVRTMLLAAGAAYAESRRLGNIYAHGRAVLRQDGAAPEAALEQTLAPEWDSLGVKPEAGAPAAAPKPTKLRAAIVGCGLFSMVANVPNCVRSELIDVTWVYDPLPEKAAAAAQVCGGASVAADLETILAAEDVDLCICAVPHSVHEEVVAAVAQAGKHVFTEKPMAMTMEECYRIQQAVRRGGVKLCVDYNRGSSPAMRDFKAVYQAHRAHPRVAPGNFVAAPERPILPEEEASTLVIRIQDESSTYGPVHIDWRTGGGEIIGETVHWLELACWLFEEAPVRVFATGSARMTHTITLDFASGRQAIIMFMVGGTFRYPKEQYELADHGAFMRSLCFVENQYYGIAGVEEKRYFPLTCARELEKVGGQGHEGYVAKLGARADLYAAHPEKGYLAVGVDKGHFDLLESFVRAILDDTPSPVDERAGTRATYLALRAIESLRTGHPVPVNREDMEMYIA
jgi:predicted dehydrogenase